ASRILEGHFEPLLYIAVEYCFANNFKLAADFLTDAAQVAGANALVMHEQAATAFMENDFKKAEQILMEALRLLVVHAVVVVVVDDSDPSVGGQQSVEQLMAAEVSDFWEPLYNNLGHVLRKLGRYTDAIHVHRKSLLLSVAKADAWACLGVCYASLAGTKFTANANTEAAKLAAQATEAPATT
uniref:TPR_REGION domain-containing protein n=1 Tax=Globodera pallida TaxID=36090 RepID=A0A183CLB0_GLOPA